MFQYGFLRLLGEGGNNATTMTSAPSRFSPLKKPGPVPDLAILIN